MEPDKAGIKGWTLESERWAERIGDLQMKAQHAQGGLKAATLELIEHLEHQKAMLDKYLEKIAAEEAQSRGKVTGDLERMFNDIDETYRKTMSYF